MAASLLQSDLVDDLVIFNAGLALGAGGIASLGALDWGALADANRFMLRDIARIGPDTMTLWQRR